MAERAPMPGDTWYRCDGLAAIGVGVRIDTRTFRVERVSDASVWLRETWGDGDIESSVVLLRRRSATRQFAWPSRKDALVSFMARKRKQIKILNRQLDDAKWALSLAAEDMAAIGGGDLQ